MLTFLSQINYIGEELIWGDLGHFFVLLAFVAAILGTYSYFHGTTHKDIQERSKWISLGRKAFITHIVAVVGIIVILFMMLLLHRYEYYYVWKHSSNELPLRFIFSCFWEGQEGSFLLWAFWHVVLGGILLKTAKSWEAPVMTIFSFTQVFLISMLLGLYFDLPEFMGGQIQIGSSPFTLLFREHPDYTNLPMFLNPNYLENLDGNGLNPLLQNYWMTIHPPVLFLGFASTLVPFAFAIAGLWLKKFNEWMQPVLPWVFFGVMILGTGILMGGAWAYEALSFGGFWAWDPVENASLMPWLLFVAAGHVMLIQKKKGESSYITFVLTILSFIFVLYSTYLTRSGILGDTSVHAFAGGLPGQLLIFMGIFFVISAYHLIQNKFFGRIFSLYFPVGIILLYYIPDGEVNEYGLDFYLKILFILSLLALLASSYRNFFPKSKNSSEEELLSREFWMFIGALILMLSAIHIIFSTSIPVFNELFGLDKVLGEEVIYHYNKFQIPIASVVALLMGFTQFLKYKNTNKDKFLKDIFLSIGITLVVFIIVSFVSDEISLTNENELALPYYLGFPLILFASLFALFGNIDYWRKILKGKIKSAGGSISHIGFALILLGAFISTSHKSIISQNSSNVDINTLTKDLDNSENILLIKGDTLPMGDYYVTYQNKYKEGIYMYFDLDFLKASENGFEKEFTLKPTVQTNEKMGNVAEPGTRHFLSKDIYTHVQWANLDTTVLDPDEYDKGTTLPLQEGDTLSTSKYIVILEKLNKNINRERYGLTPGDLAVGAHLKFITKDNKEYMVYPVFVLRNDEIFSTVEKIDELDAIVQYTNIEPSSMTHQFTVFQKNGVQKDFIILKAMEFPMINILWLGCIIMIIGGIISIIFRVKQNRKLAA